MKAGTKAVPLQEWINSFIYSKDVRLTQTDIAYMRSVIVFYSTPFTPDMITKYFAGWKEREGDETVLLSGDNMYIICFYDGEFTIDGEMLKNPSTIGVFITYCNEHNINLIWKEDIGE